MHARVSFPGNGAPTREARAVTCILAIELRTRIHVCTHTVVPGLFELKPNYESNKSGPRTAREIPVYALVVCRK